jgi:ribosomal protein L7Ae-like RNA K-turn-binding protein
MANKIDAAVQLALRAGAVVTGPQLMKLLPRKKVYYVIIATDTSASATAMIIERLDYYKIPYRITETKAHWQMILNKQQFAYLGITNKNLAILSMNQGGQDDERSKEIR